MTIQKAVLEQVSDELQEYVYMHVDPESCELTRVSWRAIFGAVSAYDITETVFPGRCGGNGLRAASGAGERASRLPPGKTLVLTVRNVASTALEDYLSHLRVHLKWLAGRIFRAPALCGGPLLLPP